MIWFFERHQARLRYEIRGQTDGPDYELVITFPDGRQEIERYADPSAITRRSIRLERALTDAGWEPPPEGPRPAGRNGVPGLTDPARSAPRPPGGA